MKLVKTVAEYKIYQRNDSRYAVKNKSGKTVNGEEKVKVLLAEDLIKVSAASPKTEEATETSEEGEG